MVFKVTRICPQCEKRFISESTEYIAYCSISCEWGQGAEQYYNGYAHNVLDFNKENEKPREGNS